MSTTVSCVGGLPLGLGIFGFFLVSVPTASAIRWTSAVGLANVGGLAGASVVVDVGVEAVDFSEPFGMSAVFVLPQAAMPTQQAVSASAFERWLSRITARTLPGHSKAADAGRRIAPTGNDHARQHSRPFQGTPRSRR